MAVANVNSKSNNIINGIGVFLRKLNGLSLVTRWNFHYRIKEQNVADHSYWVAVYTMVLVKIHNDEWNKRCSTISEYQRNEISVEKAIQHALLHDMDESITCDLPYLVKRQVTDWASVQLSALNSMTERLPQEWQRFLKDMWVGKDDQIYDIVKAADLLDVIRYCDNETALGNLQYLAIKQETITRLIDMDIECVNSLLNSLDLMGTPRMALPKEMTHL